MDDTGDPYELALSVLASTPTILAALVQPLSQDAWRRSPAPGEWSPYEVLTHLLNAETAVIPVRVRRMLEEDGAPFARPAPTAAPGTPGTATTPEEVLAAWQSARSQSLSFLRTLTPEQLVRSGEHPRYRRISAREHIIEWAYHDLEHLRQLHATLEAHLYPSIGGFRALYSPPFPTGESPA